MTNIYTTIHVYMIARNNNYRIFRRLDDNVNNNIKIFKGLFKPISEQRQSIDCYCSILYYYFCILIYAIRVNKIELRCPKIGGTIIW